MLLCSVSPSPLDFYFFEQFYPSILLICLSFIIVGSYFYITNQISQDVSFVSNILDFFKYFFKKGHKISTKTENEAFLNKKNILLIIIILCFFGNNYGLNLHNIITNQRNKIFRTGVHWWFNDTFVCGSSQCENEKISQGWSYWDENVEISDCFFSRYLEYSGDGGVIFVEQGAHMMCIYFSMFYNCSCSSYGGAIYFHSANSNLKMICANMCSAQVFYHFAFLCASLMNHMEYTSVSHCSHIIIGDSPIFFQYGDQRIDNNNNSMNSATGDSGIYLYNPSTFSSSHCTFSNNYVSFFTCIYIQSDSSSNIISISSANIIHNNSPFGGIVFVYECATKMKHCIFQKNHNYLFYVQSGSLEVSHSFIDHSSESFSDNLPVNTLQNNSMLITLTYQIQFFKSLYCNADIPLPQRTMDQSPMRSLQETLKMTLERTIEETMRETLKETIQRSYAECVCSCQIAKRRNMNVIFHFSFLYPMI